MNQPIQTELITETLPPAPQEMVVHQDHQGVPLGALTVEDPEDVVTRGAAIATALKKVIDKQGLSCNIQGKTHVLAEGWNTLGALIGVLPREDWTKGLDNSSGWEAYVSLVKASDGTVIGGASAMVTRSEKRWAKSDDYAIRSMAITRATSKAYRMAFSWIVKLAGYEVTPAEEMPDHETPPQKPQTAPRHTAKTDNRSPQQLFEDAWNALVDASGAKLAQCAAAVGKLKASGRLQESQYRALQMLAEIRGGADLEAVREEIDHEYTHDLGCLDDTLYAKLFSEWKRANDAKPPAAEQEAVSPGTS